MSLTLADTHNMVAYLNKSDVSKGFNQVIDFLNASYIKLQALVDKEKVVIMEATIRDTLRLNDAEGVDCLPNEEIFAELARMGRKLNFSKYIFKSLVRNVDGSSKFYMYPRRVEHLEYDKVAQALKITKLKRRVKKLEKANKVKVLKLRRLKKVGTSQRINTSNDTVVKDASNQGRMIDALDSDAGVALMDDKEDKKRAEEANVAGDDQVKGRQAKIYKIDMDHALKVLSMQDDEPEVNEVVDVVTTAKLITKVVTAASKSVTAASITIAAVEPQVSAATITAALVRVAAASTGRRKGVDVAIDHVKHNAKEDLFVQRYQVMKKRPQAEAQARKNMIMYLKNGRMIDALDSDAGVSLMDDKEDKKKAEEANVAEQLEEEENRAIQSINETPVQKAAKRRKLNEEVEDLKQHLEIMLDEDDDVYIEATPLARKMDRLKFERVKGVSMVKQRLRVRSCWNLRLRVEEQSEMSMEPLRLTRQQHQEGQLE
nr:hypothetical protein [Tanacetum cinerariifolium]